MTPPSSTSPSRARRNADHAPLHLSAPERDALAGLLPLHALADAAVAVDQSVSVTEDVAQPITLAATGGGGALTFSVVDGPLHGSLTGTAPDLTYTPAANYNGGDSFTFTANDTIADSNTATVTITDAVNDPPDARDDPSLACGTAPWRLVPDPGGLERWSHRVRGLVRTGR